MNKAFFSNESDAFVLLFSLIIILGCGLFLFVLSLLIAVPVFNISVPEIMEIVQGGVNPGNIDLFKYFQICQTIGIFIIPAILIGYLVNKKPFQFLQFKNLLDKQAFILLIIVILTIVIANPFINIMAFFNQQMKLPAFLSKVELWMQEKEKSAEDLTIAFLTVKTTRGLILNIFMIGILPALGEEMIFRGIIQRQFTNVSKNIHVGVFAAAFIFTLVHFQFYGLLPRFMLGVYLGYLLAWTGNIWYPVVAHFVNNALAVTVYYYMNISGTQYEVDHIGISKDTYLFGIGSTIFTIILVTLFYKISTNEHSH